ncbi:MAG: exodeoxyribonuclease VII large subunit [candidate division Zixibacteria bacterium]|nr:exodeoxyribonuclease VII large subunit [candidate division Zixibacteria bacterium]
MEQKMQAKIYKVSEITREIKNLLEQSFPTLWVEGEISNYTLHSSGHRYFSLKDENAQIRCVLFRWEGRRLGFEPQDGMKVYALGNLTVYEKSGQYQLSVIRLHPVGIGELELAFQQLKERLYNEGLFDEAHKKPIPEYPQTIGVVTSPTGAAIRDIINIIHRRDPGVKIILYPARVQGEGAGEEIAQAIKDFNEYKKVDLLIVGRGGGSLEDLWAFNEEVVARAIYNSKIPVISAVGHEVDFTIADFVADLRAPTPSAAAELAVKNRLETAKEVKNLFKTLISTQRLIIEDYKSRINSARESYGFRRAIDLIAQKAQRADELLRGLLKEVKNYFDSKKKSLSLVSGKLNALSPLAVLERGFSLTRKLPQMEIIRDAGSLRLKDEIEVKFFRGRIEAEVKKVEKEQ